MTREEYVLLALANHIDSGLVDVLTSAGASALMVCPECGGDDFAHEPGCEVAEIVDDAAADVT